jgi:diguanylate cyclase (GGDEF)-like protein/PAS domain S-box-containing protein
MDRLLSEQQVANVTMVADGIDREMQDRLQTLARVAVLITPDMVDEPLSLQAFLEQRPDLHALFNGGIYAARLDGTAIADFPLSSGRLGVDYSDRDYIARPLKEGKATIGRPVVGKKAQAPIFGMAVPIHDNDGRVIGALAGITNLEIQSFLDQISKNRYGKTGGYLLVAPQHRLIVTATDKQRIMESSPPIGAIPEIDRFHAGFEGSAVYVNPLGVEMLTSTKAVPVAGWYVAANLPTTEAFAPIRDMQRRVLVTTVLFTIVAGVLIWWTLRRQLHPIFSTMETLANMSTSDELLRPLPIIRKDEIGQLIGGFNRLIESVRQSQEALRLRDHYQRALLDNFPFLVWLKNADSRFLAVNQPYAAACGLASPSHVVGKSDFDLWPSDLAETYRAEDRAVLESGRPIADEEAIEVDGQRTWFESYRSPVSVDGVIIGIVGFSRDITERKQVEEKLHFAASVFTHAREGIMITTPDGKIIDVNETFTRITGFSREEALGRNPRLLNSGRHEKTFYRTMWRSLIEMGDWNGEIWNRRKNGENFAAMLTISTVRNSEGQIKHYVALFSDITMAKAHERQLEHIAHFDMLTTLPNRVLLADRLHQAMAHAERREQRLAVAYLDLDGFKAINDQYGHETGDQLLIALSSRMKQTLREGDTLARLGGDEFVAVLLDLPDVASSEPMLQRLLAAAAQPEEIGMLKLQVSASLGVTFYPQADDVDADQLLRQADQAMYQAKLAGKNRYHVFDDEQDRSVRGHHESLEGIRRALSAGEFVLHYQPKVNMRTGVVVGAEALIRWQHPLRGLLPPAVFLPVIEDHPLAVDIGNWVIDSALSQMQRWRAEGLDIPVSVNVGARQLQQTDFVERLRQSLAAYPSTQPGDLEMEVLETSALEDLVRVSQIIEDCREIGVMFSLDDFGTGYSSLTYLKRLSVTQLKIDQSFVRDMLDDPDDLAILGGVLSLATAFRRQVIAEGVETVEHGELLLQLGCELAQGYGIARPMPAADMAQWAKAWKPDITWSKLPAVNRDDLPLLFANVEHRAWIVAFEAFLRGQRETLPLIHHQCSFGRWLENEGQTRHGRHPVFDAIIPLHEQLHALATELQELHAEDRNAEALRRLDELHGLRNALHGQLKALVQA